MPFYGTLEFSRSWNFPASISLFAMVMNVICSRTWIILRHFGICMAMLSYILMESVNLQNRNLGYSVLRVFNFH